MIATRFFLERHRPLHGELIPLLLRPLSEDQLRARPHTVLNPIGWMLWHMARAEDVGVNRLVADRGQLFDEEDWAARLNVGRRDIGTSMSSDEVRELASAIDLRALTGYREAVARRTVQAVQELEPARLDEPVEAALVERVLLDEGAAGPDARWLAPEYAGQTRAWCLNHFGLTHNFYHLGQAFVARKFLGVPGPW